VTRSLEFVAKSCVKLKAAVLAVAIMFNVVIPSLFFATLRPHYASLFTDLSWSFVSKDDLSEILAFAIVLLIAVRVVSESLLVSHLLLFICQMRLPTRSSAREACLVHNIFEGCNIYFRHDRFEIAMRNCLP
jgi:hypothetical protein